MVLFYDLVFVVAVAQLGIRLSGDHSPIGVLSFLAFFRPQTPPIAEFGSAGFCSQSGSLLGGLSADLMHNFATLSGTTASRIRPVEWHSGVDLCKIPHANFPESTFHAIR
jgi:hypothetical protein